MLLKNTAGKGERMNEGEMNWSSNYCCVNRNKAKGNVKDFRSRMYINTTRLKYRRTQQMYVCMTCGGIYTVSVPSK